MGLEIFSVSFSSDVPIRRCKTTVTMDGNKLITSQKATKSGEKDVVAVSLFSVREGQGVPSEDSHENFPCFYCQVREFSDAGLTLTTTCDGVTAVQTFVRA